MMLLPMCQSYGHVADAESRQTNCLRSTPLGLLCDDCIEAFAQWAAEQGRVTNGGIESQDKSARSAQTGSRATPPASGTELETLDLFRVGRT